MQTYHNGEQHFEQSFTDFGNGNYLTGTLNGIAAVGDVATLGATVGGVGELGVAAKNSATALVGELTAETAAESGGADIALGFKNAGTRDFAKAIGADHLLDVPESQWKDVFQAHVADPTTTFHVNLNGFSGSTPEEMIMNEMQNGANTGWELQQLQNADRLPQVNFYLPGTTTPVPNPFTP